MMAKILVIDDDQDLLRLIKNTLKNDDVTVKNSPLHLEDTLKDYDLILLDVMMPQVDGFTFLREHRQQIDVPVLFLTAKDFEEDLITGFASGGDDYITKPFSIKELRARVAAHLRRERREKHVRLADGEITCDLIQRKFFVQKEEVPLTPSEYDICVFLLQHRGQVFSKEDIYTTVYGWDAAGDSQTTITERVKQIRHKFQPFSLNPIQTVWGIGYKWELIH